MNNPHPGTVTMSVQTSPTQHIWFGSPNGRESICSREGLIMQCAQLFTNHIYSWIQDSTTSDASGMFLIQSSKNKYDIRNSKLNKIKIQHV